MKKRRLTVFRITGYKRVLDNVIKCKRKSKFTTITQKFTAKGKSKIKVITTFPNSDIDELRDERIRLYESRNKTNGNN